LTAVLATAPHRRALLATLATVLAVGALGACSGERPELSDDTSSTSSTTEAPTTTTTVPEPPVAEVAQAHEKSIGVYASADAANPDRQIVSGVDTSVDTIPVVFLVKGDRVPDAERVEVYLPVRPNGSSGWVNTDEVEITAVPYRIEVGITEHRIRVFRDEEIILDEPVGVGRTDRPTPGGIYYLKELLQPPNPNGSYGTYAYGLSGFSNVLQSFNGGSGVIGIHGTNEPDKVGTDVSSGCIRLNNENIERMVEEIGLPLGTPVEILA
jgi:lipoprotein-anchoring transpeptidase ErfK/SrfK